MFEFDLSQKENLTVRVQIKIFFEKTIFVSLLVHLMSNKILKTKISCVRGSIYFVIC